MFLPRCPSTLFLIFSLPVFPIIPFVNFVACTVLIFSCLFLLCYCCICWCRPKACVGQPIHLVALRSQAWLVPFWENLYSLVSLHWIPFLIYFLLPPHLISFHNYWFLHLPATFYFFFKLPKYTQIFQYHFHLFSFLWIVPVALINGIGDVTDTWFSSVSTLSHFNLLKIFLTQPCQKYMYSLHLSTCHCSTHRCSFPSNPLQNFLCIIYTVLCLYSL